MSIQKLAKELATIPHTIYTAEGILEVRNYETFTPGVKLAIEALAKACGLEVMSKKPVKEKPEVIKEPEVVEEVVEQAVEEVAEKAKEKIDEIKKVDKKTKRK